MVGQTVITTAEDQARTRLESKANQTLEKLSSVPSKEQKKGITDRRALE